MSIKHVLASAVVATATSLAGNAADAVNPQVEAQAVPHFTEQLPVSKHVPAENVATYKVDTPSLQA